MVHTNQRSRFTLIGGDKRMVYAANLLSEEHDTYTYGINCSELSERVKVSSTIKDAVESSDVIIGPLPCSLDGETINCSFFDEKIYIKDIFRLMNKNQQFFAGLINDKIKQTAHVYNVFFSDYLEREEFAVLNCIPTAEGAIQIAMEQTPYTIHQSKCLILGFGRIGKILAKMLNAIGADVTVEARKYEDLAWIESYGYKKIHLSSLENYIDKFDIIFNTIPSLILNEGLLKKVKKDCLIIDLASKPGGVDFEAAKALGIKTNWALSLPGKVAPYTAASIIKKTIFNIIDELGV